MRYVTAELTVNANTTTNVTTIQTPDDNNVRTLERVWMSPQTAPGVLLAIQRAGFQLAQIDAQRYVAGNWPTHLGEQFPETIQFSYQIQNTTGSNVTVAVVFGYDVGATPGSRPAPMISSL